MPHSFTMSFKVFLEDPGKPRCCSTNTVVIKLSMIFQGLLYGAAKPKQFDIMQSDGVGLVDNRPSND